MTIGGGFIGTENNVFKIILLVTVLTLLLCNMFFECMFLFILCFIVFIFR